MQEAINNTNTVYPILSKLQNVEYKGKNKEGKDQWIAQCPIHDDSKSSLSISEGNDGKALIHCHACGKGALTDILLAVNAKWSDIFPKRHDDHYFTSNDSKSKGGKSLPQNSKIVATYDYLDESGELLYQACRMDPKDFRQRRPDPDRPGQWLWNMKGVTKVPYKLPDVLSSRSGTIFVVEGEKDADNLTALGLTATTNVGGAGKWLVSYNQYFHQKTVFILPDNDQPGQQHAEHVAYQLYSVAAQVKIVNLPGIPPKGDVSDWLKSDEIVNQTGSEKAKRLLQLCTESEVYDGKALPPQQPTTAKIKKSPELDLSDPKNIAQEYLKRTSRDDQFTVRFWRGMFYLWNGKAYAELSQDEFSSRIFKFSEDIADEFHKNEMKIFCEQINLNPDAKEPKRYVVRIGHVNNVVASIKARVILDAKKDAPFFINPEVKIDADPIEPKTLLCMENCLFSVDRFFLNQPAEFQFTPNFFCLNQLAYPYEKDADFSKFLEILEKMCVDNVLDEDENIIGSQIDNEKIDIWQEWCGYNLVHNTDYHKFLVLEGEGGTGKSSLCAMLKALIGKGNYSSIGLEQFSERFALVGTLGKLANIITETSFLDQKKGIEGNLKAFTSGDSMTFERKGQDSFTGLPSARLTIATNTFPRLKDMSDGVWRRLINLKFDRKISESEQVKGMDKESWWIDSGLLPGILRWSLFGLMRLRENEEFTYSTNAEKNKEENRLLLNPVQQFIKENIEASPGDEVKLDDIYQRYIFWCESSKRAVICKDSFGREVKKRFTVKTERRRDSDNQKGNHRAMYYVGIKIKEILY